MSHGFCFKIPPTDLNPEGGEICVPVLVNRKKPWEVDVGSRDIVDQLGILVAVKELAESLPDGSPHRSGLVDVSQRSLDALVAGLGDGVTFRRLTERETTVG